ncbi:MAG: hypothetical protein EOO87_05350 [Pedobacter sp.]|nr:MAG: hypothetical protein EOO87_05350 [Pedobacter sp.]
MKIIFTLLFVAASFITFGQTKQVPKNLKQAVDFLNADCTDSLKRLIKRTEDSDLKKLSYPWDGNYKTIFEWTSKKNSKIVSYLKAKGTSSHQTEVILIAFKRFLDSQEINEDLIIAPYKALEKKWTNEDVVRFTTDSLRGVYIPKNLEDCFKQIDKFWNASTKEQVKNLTEEKFTANAHLGFGMWMRNNWQLWAGSRLTKYFNDLGVYHPEDISGIILTSYHRYLVGSDIKMGKQIEYLKSYWKVSKDPSKEIYPAGAKNLKFDTKQYYNLKKDNSPGCIHIQSNSKTEKTWVYDYYFGWKQLSREELKELSNTSYDTREDAIKKLFNKRS